MIFLLSSEIDDYLEWAGARTGDKQVETIQRAGEFGEDIDLDTNALP